MLCGSFCAQCTQPDSRPSYQRTHRSKVYALAFRNRACEDLQPRCRIVVACGVPALLYVSSYFGAGSRALRNATEKAQPSPSEREIVPARPYRRSAMLVSLPTSVALARVACTAVPVTFPAQMGSVGPSPSHFAARGIPQQNRNTHTEVPGRRRRPRFDIGVVDPYKHGS